MAIMLLGIQELMLPSPKYRWDSELPRSAAGISETKKKANALNLQCIWLSAGRGLQSVGCTKLFEE